MISDKYENCSKKKMCPLPFLIKLSDNISQKSIEQRKEIKLYLKKKKKRRQAIQHNKMVTRLPWKNMLHNGRFIKNNREY